MQKLKNIEFIRTYLIITIVLLHTFINRSWCLCSQYSDIGIYKIFKNAFSHSNNSVEGFFIIAGFLLVLTFKNNTRIVDFIKKKYLRLSPVIAFSVLFFIIGDIFNIVSFKPIPDILSILLLNNFGICLTVADNPVLWFTSALFASLLLYFCIYKYISKKYTLVIISLLTIAGYVALELLQGGKFSHPLNNYYGILNVGFLRALGGIGLGCLLGVCHKNFADKINNIKLNIPSKIGITFAEIITFLFLVWWTLTPHSSCNNIVFVLNFVLLLGLFVIKKGYFSKLTDNDIWVKLGKYQYSLYVIHYPIIKIFGLALWQNHPQFIHSHPFIPIFIMWTTIITVGVFSHHFIELPCVNRLKKTA